MSIDTSKPTWREKLTLAAVRGAVSGAVRSIIMWMLER
jgi:hypothetical protein